MATIAPKNGPVPSALPLLGLALVVVAGSHCSVHEQPVAASFDLEGTHAAIACSECHGGDYTAELPRTCTGCHESERPQPHWQESCDECHGQERWDDQEFEHEEYELTGAHLGTECSGCHEDEEWEASRICSACHEDDRPEGHITTDCIGCHSTETFEEPTWNHGFYPLEGGHDIPCSSCHYDGFHDTPDECHDCHADDAPAGHPGTGCDHCHSIYGW